MQNVDSCPPSGRRIDPLRLGRDFLIVNAQLDYGRGRMQRPHTLRSKDSAAVYPGSGPAPDSKDVPLWTLPLRVLKNSLDPRNGNHFQHRLANISRNLLPRESLLSIKPDCVSTYPRPTVYRMRRWAYDVRVGGEYVTNDNDGHFTSCLLSTGCLPISGPGNQRS